MNNQEKLIGCIALQAQDIENVAGQLKTMRSLATAEGVNLDVIGVIVGQARDGMIDDDYRRYIRARILVHRSNGTMDQLIEITKAILNVLETGHVIIRGINDASFILEVRDFAVTDPVARALQDMLCTATSAGVRIGIVYSAVPLSQTFRFDSGPGFDQGHLASIVDQSSVI